jgi:hypothetical protein
MQQPRAGPIAGALVLLVIGVWALAQALGFGLWRERSPGEGLYPFGVSLLVVGLSATALLLWWRGEITAAPDLMKEAAEDDGPPNWRKVCFYIAALVALGGLLEPLGYWIVSASVLVVILRFAERRSWLMTSAVTAVTSVATNLIFERLLGLQLPSGLLF